MKLFIIQCQIQLRISIVHNSIAAIAVIEGGSMFESETGEEEPKDKDKGKRLPVAHIKLSNNFCLLYVAFHLQVKTTMWKKATSKRQTLG